MCKSINICGRTQCNMKKQNCWVGYHNAENNHTMVNHSGGVWLFHGIRFSIWKPCLVANWCLLKIVKLQ